MNKIYKDIITCLGIPKFVAYYHICDKEDRPVGYMFLLEDLSIYKCSGCRRTFSKPFMDLYCALNGTIKTLEANKPFYKHLPPIVPR